MPSSVDSSSSTYNPSAWSPAVYGERYVDERTRPGLELIQRTQHAATLCRRRIQRVYDLGTGTGRFIPPLLDAFPDAESVVGTDTSPPMLQRAEVWVAGQLEAANKAHWASKVSFRTEDIAHFSAQPAADLVFSNAALQWLPNHPALLTHLVSQLQSGGILSVQVPNDFHRPSHTLMLDVAQVMEDDAKLERGTTEKLHRSAAATHAAGLQSYFDLLRPLCSHLDVWTTTYLHNITCPVSAGHPVAHFLSGSSLGQLINALPAERRQQYVAEYVERLTAAYPVWKVDAGDEGEEVGSCFPFERWFIVAVKK